MTDNFSPFPSFPSFPARISCAQPSLIFMHDWERVSSNYVDRQSRELPVCTMPYNDYDITGYAFRLVWEKIHTCIYHRIVQWVSWNIKLITK